MEQRPFEGLAATFNDVAEQYERARPRYPPALFDGPEELLGSSGGAVVRKHYLTMLQFAPALAGRTGPR